MSTPADVIEAARALDRVCLDRQVLDWLAHQVSTPEGLSDALAAVCNAVHDLEAPADTGRPSAGQENPASLWPGRR